MNGPIAFLTAGTSGIGRAVAAQLDERGIQVVISSRDPSRAREAANSLGPKVTALPSGLDLANPASIADAVSWLTQTYDRLDVLINNAAAYVDWTQTVTNADLQATRAVFDTNLFGTWHLTQALLPLLRRSGAARIVNVSSGAGSHGDSSFGLAARGGLAAAYGISKAALNALTSTLAAEVSASTILVNAVCPGLTDTFPGALAMGARPPHLSAAGIVWAATLPDDGPSGGFFRDAQPLPW